MRDAPAADHSFNRPAILIVALERRKPLTNAKKMLITIYTIGVICVCVLLVRMLIGGNKIVNLYAMLPCTYFESSSGILAIGSFPMCFVSILLYRVSVNKKRFLVFIPAIITVCFFVYWIVIIVSVFLNSSL